MESSYTGSLTKQRKDFDLSLMPFILLCGYLAVTALCYISWVPLSITSLFLYGFVGLAVACLLLIGRAKLGAHSIWYALFFCCLPGQLPVFRGIFQTSPSRAI